MSLVAAGRYDACVSLGEKSEWDIAGATVILDEAGGRASTARGAGPFTQSKWLRIGSSDSCFASRVYRGGRDARGT